MIDWFPIIDFHWLITPGERVFLNFGSTNMLRLRSYTGRMKILWLEIALFQRPSFPVPLDKGNEDSGDESGSGNVDTAEGACAFTIKMSPQDSQVCHLVVSFFGVTWCHFFFFILRALLEQLEYVRVKKEKSKSFVWRDDEAGLLFTFG